MNGEYIELSSQEEYKLIKELNATLYSQPYTKGFERLLRACRVHCKVEFNKFLLERYISVILVLRYFYTSLCISYRINIKRGLEMKLWNM